MTVYKFLTLTAASEEEYITVRRILKKDEQFLHLFLSVIIVIMLFLFVMVVWVKRIGG